MAAYGIEPDVGTGLTLQARDTAHYHGRSLGQANYQSRIVICHPGLRDYCEPAEAKGILPDGVLEGALTQVPSATRAGVPAAISIPSRYIHSPSEMVDIGDVEACVKLCVAACESPLDF